MISTSGSSGIGCLGRVFCSVSIVGPMMFQALGSILLLRSRRSCVLLASLGACLIGLLPASTEGQEAIDPVLLSAYERLDAGDVEGARQIFDELVRRDASFAEAHAGLATTSAARGDWASVAREADAAVALDPTIPIAQTLLCRARVVLGDYRLSDVACHRAIALDPEDPTAYASMCASNVARYRWSEAVDYCRTGADAEPDDAGMRWRLGVALTQVGRLSDAEQACNAAVQLAPDDPMSHYCLGAVYLTRDQDGAALATCESAVSVGPRHALAYYCRGMAHLGLGNIGEAQRDCGEAVALAPGEALGHFCLGRIASDTGAVPEAVGHLTRAVSLNDQLIEARGTLGDVLTRGGDPQAGEPWLREALSRQASADRHAMLAHNLYVQGRYEESLASYAAAEQLRPGDPRHHANMANCHRGLGDHAAMYEEFELAIALEPENPRWAMAAVETALALRQFPRARDLATAALERHPNHPGLNVARCDALVRVHSYPSAEVACVRAAAVATQDATPALLLGVVYIDSQRAVEAEQALRTAIERGANDGYTWSNLGSALLGQGRTDEAVTALREATRLAPELAHGHYTLGTALERAGRDDAARAAFCQAARLEPGRTAYQSRCPAP